YLPDQLIRSLRGRLREQVCYGSDYPIFEPRQLIEDCRGLALPEAVADGFLKTNALGYLRLAGPALAPEVPDI
ncbi:MAG: hypothetical protein ABI468_04110, partial [Candidatus Nanopelagicales bacterium]